MTLPAAEKVTFTGTRARVDVLAQKEYDVPSRWWGWPTARSTACVVMPIVTRLRTVATSRRRSALRHESGRTPYARSHICR